MAITTNIENKDLREHPKATREFWKEFLGIEKGSELESEPWFLCVHKDDDDRLILYRRNNTQGNAKKLDLKKNPNCKNARRNPLHNAWFKKWLDGPIDTSEKATEVIE